MNAPVNLANTVQILHALDLDSLMQVPRTAIRWRWIDDFLLKSEFSLGFMRTYKTYLSAKQEQDGHLFLPYDSGICGC